MLAPSVRLTRSASVPSLNTRNSFSSALDNVQNRQPVTANTQPLRPTPTLATRTDAPASASRAAAPAAFTLQTSSAQNSPLLTTPPQPRSESTGDTPQQAAAPFKPIPVPAAHLKTEQQRLKSTSGVANVSSAVCCALRALVDNFIGLADAGSALKNQQQSGSHETGIPATNSEIAAAAGIGSVAVLGAASAGKVFQSYKGKQKLADASLFYIKANEQAATTDEQKTRVGAADFAVTRMRNKVKREKWMAGGMPAASMGFMAAAQGYTKLIPGSLALSSAIDALQVAKIAREVHQDKPVLGRIETDLANTRAAVEENKSAVSEARTDYDHSALMLDRATKSLAEKKAALAQSAQGDAERRTLEQEIAHMETDLPHMKTALQARKKTFEALNAPQLRLDALSIQKNSYFAPKQREQKISATLWGIQTAGAAAAAAGTATMNPVLVGTGLGAVGIAVGGNLRYNTRTTDADRFAPEPKLVDYNTFRGTVKIENDTVVAAFPDRLPSRSDVEQKLRTAADNRTVAKDFDRFFWKQQKTSAKIKYTLWRNSNRVLGFATLGLAPATHGRSKLAAKTYLANQYTKRMRQDPAVFAKTMDYFDRLNPQQKTAQPRANTQNFYSPQERLHTFYDTIEKLDVHVGHIGKLQSRKVLKSHRSWQWKPEWKIENDTVSMKSSLRTLLPASSHKLEMIEKYDAVLNAKKDNGDIKELLTIMHNLGICCDATFDARELIDEKRSNYFVNGQSGATQNVSPAFQDFDAQQVKTLEHAEYEPAVRYLWKMARVNARRDIGYYSEYLAGFQKDLQPKKA